LRIVYRRRALADIESIFRYIAKDNPAAARSVVARIVQALHRLERFPKSGRIGQKAGTRELSVPGLPYLAIHQIIETPEGAAVEIVAVYHTARSRQIDDY
jgi:toxin ParE1/3/4